MNTSKRRYFAVGFKNHVELRVSKKPPQEFRSSTCQEIQQEVIPRYVTYTERYSDKFEYRDGCYHHVPARFTTKKMNISMIFHKGGSVVGSVSRPVFYSQMRWHLALGSLVELDKTQMDRLRKVMRKW
jgi:hypothetical protein